MRKVEGICALLVVAAGAVGGCRAAQQAHKPDPNVKVSYDTRGRLENLTFDRNHDGKPDAWLHMRGAHVISADFDDNYDGVIDRREFYADEAQATSPQSALDDASRARGEVIRVEESTNNDGKMNRVQLYEHGQLAHVEEDTNGDGRVDKWETWSHGVPVVLELDTKGSGRPDRRFIYGADGSERMEVDTKGDGTFTPVTR
jgi:hypothetical protein